MKKTTISSALPQSTREFKVKGLPKDRCERLADTVRGKTELQMGASVCKGKDGYCLTVSTSKYYASKGQLINEFILCITEQM